MPLPVAPPRHVRSLAREEVYRQLSDWIIEGVLQPEETLKDQEIAERLGVSRTPVREALRRLEDEGLVETAQNRWTRVASLHVDQAARLYPVIEALEDLAFRLAAPTLTTQDTGRLSALNEILRNALESSDASAAVQADTDFHDVWIARSGNSELQQTLLVLKRKLRRVELAYFSAVNVGQVSVEEHEALLAALQRMDLEAALSALHGNWEGSLRRLQNHLHCASRLPK